MRKNKDCQPSCHSFTNSLLTPVKKKKRFILTNLLCKHKNKSAGPDKSHFKATCIVKICTECFQIFKALGERKDYTESQSEKPHTKTARCAHSAILLLQLGQVIISHCCNLDYIPNGITWELFYETMLSVFYPFGTCPLKYNDYLRIMKPKMTKTKAGRGALLLLVSSSLQNYRNPPKTVHVWTPRNLVLISLHLRNNYIENNFFLSSGMSFSNVNEQKISSTIFPSLLLVSPSISCLTHAAS